MKKKTLLVPIVFILIITNCYAQLSDLARIDYTILPKSEQGIEYTRFRALFNYPLKLKKEDTYLFLGLDYSNINVINRGDNPIIDTDDLDDFQLLDFNIGYTTPLKNDWRLGIQLAPGVSSNLTASDLTLDDLVLSGVVVFIKDKTKDTTLAKPWRLILGASYSGNRGFSFPLPFISYYKRLNPKWSYNLGIPKTNLQYRITEKHRIKLFTQLDGFTSHIQSGLQLDNGLADTINMSLIVGGLQYEFHIIKHLEFYARAASILNNNIELRDQNRNTILELDSSNRLYLRTGIRFKI